jgi:glycosyltransferase involved in cell wall biosynthesis
MVETFFQRRRSVPLSAGRRVESSARISKGPSVSLVIPALNEADGLRGLLPRVPALVDELIVVDGGSTDGTVEVVHETSPHAIVIRQTGRGKGDALKCGIAEARGEIIVTMDADGSMNPEDIPRFVASLIAGHDFVKGSRMLPGAGSSDFTWLRRAGNASLTWVGNIVFGSRYTDITFGYNAYWRPTIQHLGELADGFEFEIQAALRAASVGMRTAEVPTHEPARVGGESKLNPFTDGLAILRIILSEASPRKGVKLATPPVPAISDPTFQEGLGQLAGTEIYVSHRAPTSAVLGG